MSNYKGSDKVLDYITLLPGQNCKIPPHIFSKLINDLRDVSVKYKDTQQIRAHISNALVGNGILPNHNN